MAGRSGGGYRGAWARLEDEDLLELRICELGVSLEATEFPRLAQDLYAELEDAGLGHFRPQLYLGDEWFSPEGVPAIAVPFYLAHPRLSQLERAVMHRVEGRTRTECRRLLRHEAGHCFDHAYRVSRRKDFRAIFGSSSQPYDPDAYRPDPTSKDFVHHLPGHYAQSHPDEDFAETFAVCITPGSDWRRRYRAWPGALEKLEFVTDLIERFGDTPPKVKSGRRLCDARVMTSTLGRYYQRRLSERDAARERRRAIG